MSVSDFEPQLANCNVISEFFLLEQPHSIIPQKSKIIITDNLENALTLFYLL